MSRNRLPYHILQSFTFPGSQGSVGSISSAGQVPEQGCRCQRQWSTPHQAKVIWDIVTYHRMTTILLDRDGFLDVYDSTVKKQDLGVLLIFKRGWVYWRNLQNLKKKKTFSR